MEKNKKEYINKRTKKIAIIMSLLGVSITSLSTIKDSLKKNYNDQMEPTKQITTTTEEIVTEERTTEVPTTNKYEKPKLNPSRHVKIEEIDPSETDEYNDPEIVTIFRFTNDDGTTDDVVFYKWMFEEDKNKSKKEDEDKMPPTPEEMKEKYGDEDYDPTITKPMPDYEGPSYDYDKDVRKIRDDMDEDKDDKTKPYPEEDVTPSVTKSKTIKKKIQ